MITVKVQSGDTADIFATITDNNTNPPQVVLDRKRLNYGSAAVDVKVQEDGTNKCNVDWEAERCDDVRHKNSGNERRGDGDLFYIDAG
jgi:hypothetical protein